MKIKWFPSGGQDMTSHSGGDGQAYVASRARPMLRWSELVVLGVGLLSGALAAVAYYNVALNPLTHSLTLWIALTVVVVRQQPATRAVTRATLVLLGAVVAFYVGKKIVYGIEYPGSSYELNVVTLTFWSLLAISAGVLLGLLFRRIGNADRRGRIATAAAIGLLLGDLVRGLLTGSGLLLVIVTCAAVAIVMWLGSRSGRDAIRIAAWALPLTVAGFAAVIAPDLLGF